MWRSLTAHKYIMMAHQNSMAIADRTKVHQNSMAIADRTKVHQTSMAITDRSHTHTLVYHGDH